MLVVSPWSRGGWVFAGVRPHLGDPFPRPASASVEPNIGAQPRRGRRPDFRLRLRRRSHRVQHADSVRHACALPYALKRWAARAPTANTTPAPSATRVPCGAVLHHATAGAGPAAAPLHHRRGRAAGRRLATGHEGAYDPVVAGSRMAFLPGPAWRRYRRRPAPTQLVPVNSGLRLRLINHGDAHLSVQIESRMGDGWRAMVHRAGRRRAGIEIRWLRGLVRPGYQRAGPRPLSAGTWRAASAPARRACRTPGCARAPACRRADAAPAPGPGALRRPGMSCCARPGANAGGQAAAGLHSSCGVRRVFFTARQALGVLDASVAHIGTLDHVDHAYGHVLGVIADALERAGDEDHVDGTRNGARVFDHVGDQDGAAPPSIACPLPCRCAPRRRPGSGRDGRRHPGPDAAWCTFAAM